MKIKPVIWKFLGCYKTTLQCSIIAQRCVDTVLLLPPLTDNSFLVQFLESGPFLGHTLTNRSEENDIMSFEVSCNFCSHTIELLRLPCSEEASSSLPSDKRPQRKKGSNLPDRQRNYQICGWHHVGGPLA